MTASLKQLHIKTPLLKSGPLSSVSGKTVFLKMESSQPTGSFKIRGIGHLAQTLVSEEQQLRRTTTQTD